MSTRRAPNGLAAGGRKLWRDVLAGFELRPDEERMLIAACRTVDELARLERALKNAKPVVAGSKGQDRVNPLFGEVRAHRLALRQLLAAIGIEEAADDRHAGDVRSNAGRKLARQRWGHLGAA
jgi:hypothetical protein